MDEPPTAPTDHGLGAYLLGFALALALTIIPFALVASGALPKSQMLAVIALAAVLQILVHLRYFLHLDLTSTPSETLLTIAFAAVLILIMLGGSFWIMSDLHHRMLM
jgi:cytochrome o ubiquinol oxidase operon protein cyoD